MMFLFKIWPDYFKKNIITFQILRLQLKTVNQNCNSSELTLQLPQANTILFDSAIYIEKKNSGKSTVAKT
jgi:hypothetical protein